MIALSETFYILTTLPLRPGNKVYPRLVTYKQLPRSCGGTTSLLSNLLFPLLSIMRVLQIFWKL
jgi:hypothetical protein